MSVRRPRGHQRSNTVTEIMTSGITKTRRLSDPPIIEEDPPKTKSHSPSPHSVSPPRRQFPPPVAAASLETPSASPGETMTSSPMRERSATTSDIAYFSNDPSSPSKTGRPRPGVKNPSRSESKKGRIKKVKKYEDPKKPEIPMYVSDGWLSKWISLSGDVNQEWLFTFDNPKTEFYSPIEHKLPLELLQYETATKELSPMPVLATINGHVLRIFKGAEYSAEQILIITFNLREISATISKLGTEKERDKLLVISRFHGRVFIFQPLDMSDNQVVELVHSLIVINSHWARKFSRLDYPAQLTAMLWPDSTYVKREALSGQIQAVGWVTYGGGVGSGGGSSLYARFDLDEKMTLNLFKNEEDPKPKTKLRIENGMVFPANEKSKGRGISFFLIWGKKKDVKKDMLLFTDISGLERWVFGSRDDQTLLAPFESRIVKMVSHYSTKPIPIAYHLHPHLYSSLEENTIKIDRTISVKFKQTRDSVDEVGGIPGNMQGLGVIMDTFGDVIEEMGVFQDRIDNVEILQERMANIIDLEANRVEEVERKVISMLEKNTHLDTIDAILDKVDALELKLNNALEQIYVNSSGAGLGSSTGMGGNGDTISMINLRLEAIETKIESLQSHGKGKVDLVSLETRLATVEKQLARQHELEETVQMLTTKLGTLGIVCQKLASQLKGNQ